MPRFTDKPAPLSFTRRLTAPALLVCACLIPGCGKESTKPAPKTPPVNSDSPNANVQIVSQQISGDPAKKSSLWELRTAGGSTEWFIGLLDGNWVVGRVNSSGTVASQNVLAYEPRDIEALTAASPLPGGAIVVGAVSTGGSTPQTKGHVSLVTSTGVVASDLLYASDSSDVWLNEIAPLTDSLYVAVGVERTPARTNPLVALIGIVAPRTLEKRQQAVLLSIVDRTGTDVATNPGDALAATRRIYLATTAATGTSTITIHGMDITASTFAPWALTWSQTLPGAGSWTYEKEMVVSGGVLYVVGFAGDPSKGTSASGGTWNSGLVARLSLAGAVELVEGDRGDLARRCV